MAVGKRPELDVERILRWADAHRTATGHWPDWRSGPVNGADDETWSAIDAALRRGRRGLPGGSTLARLLDEERGVWGEENPEAPAERLRAWEAEQFPTHRPKKGNRRAARPRVKTQLPIELILAWADAHHAAIGQWPRSKGGPVRDHPAINWQQVNRALSLGGYGLPGGTSLAQLLQEHRGVRNRQNPPRLDVEQILAWAEAHHAATGRWPSSWSSGAVRDALGETWKGVDTALREGHRGLPGGTSLAQLLAEHRQAPNIYTETPLTAEGILAWADAHHEATGRWPSSNSGPVLAAEGEHWGSIDAALREGYRGLPGGQSLGRLIRGHGGPDVYRTRPELTVEGILAWADAHREATGEWPVEDSGPVRSAPGETWKLISGVLARGDRGLPGGTSLARLLAEHRGARNPKDLPRLTVEQILAWADAHRDATGRWPSSNSGPVAEGSEETWATVNTALYKGHRGLPGGTSLARLLAKHRPGRLWGLTLSKIHALAEAHREATGRWPDAYAGPVRGVPDENWAAIDAALRFGRRGLPGGSSLTDLFDRSLDPAAQGFRPKLTVEQVLAWADAYRAATGRWPTPTSGPVAGAPGEKWVNLDAALRRGRRGLPRGTCLTRLINEHRGTAALPATVARSQVGPATPAAGAAANRA